LIARAAIPRLCYQAAELAYTTEHHEYITPGIMCLCYQAAELAYTTYFTSDKKNKEKNCFFPKKLLL
jgi:hypothetical protein